APPTSPVERSDPAMTYDAAHGVVLLFGGFTTHDYDGQEFLTDTWAWDGTTWTARCGSSTLPVPPCGFYGRAGTRMVYDATSSTVLLYGGVACLGYDLDSDCGLAPPLTATQGTNEAAGLLEGLVSDTWTWDGSQWTLHRVDGPAQPNSALPPDQYGQPGLIHLAPAVAYDARLSNVLFFGLDGR